MVQKSVGLKEGKQLGGRERDGTWEARGKRGQKPGPRDAKEDGNKTGRTDRPISHTL